VFFVERSADGVNARNVFILTQSERDEAVTSARTGRLEYEGDDRFLVLERGQRNDVNLLDGTRTLSSFETYRVLAGERAVRAAERRPPRMVQTIDLIREPTLPAQGELTWRLGLALGAANLVLLGIGLAATNPRRASNWNLLFALLAFAVYYNLVTLSQSWVANGRVPMLPALLGVHGLTFAAALALLWWRDHAAVLQRLRPRRAQPLAVEGSR
jgi:lipopolysaccharide export system permease protein